MRAGSLVWPTTLMIGAALACITAIADAQQGGGAKAGATISPAGRKVSVWSGVYTAAQNQRGEEFHSATCSTCHGPQLNGASQPEMPPSPAIARAPFLRKWTGRTVAALFDYVRQTMPPDSPGTLTAQQSIDAIAHMFAVSGMPAGDRELPPDPNDLANMVIEAKP